MRGYPYRDFAAISPLSFQPPIFKTPKINDHTYFQPSKSKMLLFKFAGIRQAIFQVLSLTDVRDQGPPMVYLVRQPQQNTLGGPNSQRATAVPESANGGYNYSKKDFLFWFWASLVSASLCIALTHSNPEILNGYLWNSVIFIAFGCHVRLGWFVGGVRVSVPCRILFSCYLVLFLRWRLFNYAESLTPPLISDAERSLCFSLIHYYEFLVVVVLLKSVIIYTCEAILWILS